MLKTKEREYQMVKIVGKEREGECDRDMKRKEKRGREIMVAIREERGVTKRRGKRREEERG